MEPDDYVELYALFKTENGIDTANSINAEPLTADHLPTASTSDKNVKLLALRNLNNVNLIPNDQSLTFSDEGITVIYGGNGTGKSGYARVLKRACRARDQSEPIHPNAHDSSAANKVPTAKLDVEITGQTKLINWSRDTTPDEILSSI